MRILPLYDALPRTPLEASERLERDPGCTRCELSKGVKTVCVPPAGKPGGLLVVGEGPGKTEDEAGKPFCGVSGSYLRSEIKKHWSGPVVVSNATNCVPTKTRERDAVDVEARHVDACRPYLADTLWRAKPTRIVCVGAHAARSVVGRAVPPTKTRRGYAYLFWTRLPDALRTRAEHAELVGDDDAIVGFERLAKKAEAGECDRANWDIAVDAAVPVFFLLHPAAALRNPFMRQAFEDDLKWALTCEDPPKPPVDAVFGVVESHEDALTAVGALDRSARGASFDIEAGGVMYAPSYRVVSLAAAPVDRVSGAPVAYVWPDAHLTADPRRSLAAGGDVGRSARGVLRSWIEDDGAQKTTANGQYDVNGLRALGWVARGVSRDVRLRRKLRDPDASGYLGEMAELVGMGGYKSGADAVADAVALKILNGLKEERLRAKHAEEVARGKYRKPPKRPPEKQPELEAWLGFRQADPEMARVVEADPSWGSRWGWVYAAMAREAPEVVWRYNAKDAVATALLDPVVDAKVREVPALVETWLPIVDAMPEVVAQIEAWGMNASEAAIRAFDAYLQSRITPLEEKLARYDSVKNWKSTQQKSALIYGELGLKATKKTAGGANSVDAATLKGLSGQHEIIDVLLEHARFTDLKKSFACGLDGVSGMLRFIRSDGRMHPHILVDGTGTGRSSCDDPNLYNIPAKKYPVEGKMARDVFVAPDGRLIVSCDWSQIQLRLAAHLSDDDVMRAIFSSGVDFHQKTAELIAEIVWKIKPEEVTDQHRAHAKNFNFGLIYGMGDKALASRMFKTQQPTREQIAMAGQIRVAVLGKFKGLAAWVERTKRETRRTGMVVSQMDGRPARHRYLWDVADRDENRAAGAERESIASPIQAEEAGMMHRSTIAAVHWIWGAGIGDEVKVLLPLYDQLLLEARRERVDEVCEVIPAIMTSWPCSVPVVGDVEVGRAWGSLRKMKSGSKGWKCHASGLGEAAVWSDWHETALAAFDDAERLAHA